ncbi:MAG: flagellar hook-length control protein FliK [Candidatus Eremiobacteraeota bacterium]|nr:flagellar hook-length control protein FliK [Candidatus Eremiobacteraeota bacterium]
MSNFDPVAAAAAQAIAGAERAIEIATLQIGLSGDAFQTQIRTGDMLEAVVLPPQNGSDRLLLFGRSIDAELPPGIHPGESLILQVTGLSAEHVIVRNLGPVSSMQPLPPIYVEPPQPFEEPNPQSQLRSAPSPAAVQPMQAPSRPGAQPKAPAFGAVAPPREVFVAASVTRNFGDVSVRAETINIQTPADRTLPSRVRDASDRLAPSALNSVLTRAREPSAFGASAAFRTMDDAVTRVTTAYERLNAALAKMTSADPRVGTLRTLLAFTAKMDVSAARTLPEQLSSFVSHVVGGAENKLAQIVRALLPEEPTAASQTQARAAAPAENRPAIPATLPAQRAAPEAPSPQSAKAFEPAPAALARATERTVALEYDLKAVISSLLHDPTREITPQIAQELSDALDATTAVQLNVLSTQSAEPGSITIALPAYFYEGGRPAQLRVSRDPRKPGDSMDADTFCVAFLLDTRSLGTVAIEVNTVGRAVAVSVKTERATAANRFRDTFEHLKKRLQNLRYSVASMDANIARKNAPPPQALPEATHRAPNAGRVDLRA